MPSSPGKTRRASPPRSTTRVSPRLRRRAYEATALEHGATVEPLHALSVLPVLEVERA